MTNLPLMSSAALDNAVYELIVRELGVANAMRFIARHNQPDGIDYTRDRHNWLSREAGEVERLLAAPDAEFERIVDASRKKNRAVRRRSGARGQK